MAELSERRLGGTGTIRKNQCNGIPIQSVESVKKERRGYFTSISSEKMQLVRWNDNSVVTILSNCYTSTNVNKVSRWSGSEKKCITNIHPNVLGNAFMGGCDLHDQFIYTYPFAIRSKKWWWPLFSWVLKSALVNSFLYMKSINDQTCAFSLDHTRHVARYTCIIGTYGRSAGFRRVARPILQNSLCFDEKDHCPMNESSKYLRCKHCSRRTAYICKKCNVPINIDCFVVYHTS